MSKQSVACIAISDSKVLIAHRKTGGQMSERWEFPGGKVENGETCEQAVVREFDEEFGTAVTVGEKIASAIFVHNDKEVLLTAYRIFVAHDGMAVPYVLTEHTEYKWVEINEIPSLNFVDSDMKLYPDVKKYIESLDG